MDLKPYFSGNIALWQKKSLLPAFVVMAAEGRAEKAEKLRARFTPRALAGGLISSSSRGLRLSIECVS